MQPLIIVRPLASSARRERGSTGFLSRGFADVPWASRRTIDVPRSVLLALPGSDAEDDCVFRNRDGGPLDPDNLDRVFDRHVTLAGLPPVWFHDLRHTHVTS